ncbi:MULTISPECIES: hypothetical protein [unclassified Synechocystis]|uniref:hypothetical protein n=1 Tax=unclassified Synechocystis TaxID=2640012 RepID=UPI001CBD5453|nr:MULTISPECIES: hypothetical protein [unclassified Synechocystis]
MTMYHRAIQAPQILTKQTIHCPNCGNHAVRQQSLIEKEIVTETACPVCDYLLVNCHRTGRVVDSYLCLSARR